MSGPPDRSVPARRLRARPRLVAALAMTAAAGLLVTAVVCVPVATDECDRGARTATPTVTPVDVPTVTAATGPPPGVTGGGIESVDALTRAHVDAIRTRPGMAMDATFSGPRFLTGFDTFRSGFDADDEVRIRIRAASASRYRIFRQTTFPGGLIEGTNATLEWFADGATEYRVVDDAGERRYDRQQLSTARSGPAELVGWTRMVLQRYLNTTESRVGRLGDDPERYRVVATGRPRSLSHETRNYRAVAVVDAGGFVRNLTVTYFHPPTGTSVGVTVQYERSVTGVEPPAWYETARERTDRRLRSGYDVETLSSTRSSSPVMSTPGVRNQERSVLPNRGFRSRVESA